MNIKEKLEQCTVNQLLSLEEDVNYDGYVITYYNTLSEEELVCTNVDKNLQRIFFSNLEDIKKDIKYNGPYIFDSIESAKKVIQMHVDIRNKDLELNHSSIREKVEDYNIKKLLNVFNMEDFKSNTHTTIKPYYIMYGRGDIIEFNTLKDAKQWQVDHIYKDYRKDGAKFYKWQYVDDGYEFILLDKYKEEIDCDKTDGAGWFIEKNEED